MNEKVDEFTTTKTSHSQDFSINAGIVSISTIKSFFHQQTLLEEATSIASQPKTRPRSRAHTLSLLLQYCQGRIPYHYKATILSSLTCDLISGVNMTPFQETRMIVDEHEQQPQTAHPAFAVNHPCPTTPENRIAPTFNHPPKPKTVIRVKEQQSTPTYVRHQGTDASYELHDVSTTSTSDHVFAHDRTSLKNTDNSNSIHPVTPNRKVLYRAGHGSRTASPRACLSVDRSRR